MNCVDIGRIYSPTHHHKQRSSYLSVRWTVLWLMHDLDFMTVLMTYNWLSTIAGISWSVDGYNADCRYADINNSLSRTRFEPLQITQRSSLVQSFPDVWQRPPEVQNLQTSSTSKGFVLTGGWHSDWSQRVQPDEMMRQQAAPVCDVAACIVKVWWQNAWTSFCLNRRLFDFEWPHE